MKKKKGFTLAELLIVVAIIAVLVAISIPIFTSQLEKSRESTDLANVRAAYAEVMTEANSDSGDSSSKTYSRKVELTQKKDDWQRDTSDLTVGGIKSNNTQHWKGKPKAGGTCMVSYSEINGVVINWDGTTTHAFTSLKNYIEKNYSAIKKDATAKRGYYCLIVEKPDGQVEYIDTQGSAAGATPPTIDPSYKVLGKVISFDGEVFLFQSSDGSQSHTWTYGTSWDESALPEL